MDYDQLLSKVAGVYSTGHHLTSNTTMLDEWFRRKISCSCGWLVQVEGSRRSQVYNTDVFNADLYRMAVDHILVTS